MDVILSAVGLGVLILAPGFLAATVLRRNQGDVVRALAEAWSSGFALSSILALVVHLIGLGLVSFLWAWAGVTMVLGIAAARRIRERWVLPGPARGFAAVLVATIALAGILGDPNPLSAYRDDGAHLAEIEAAARTLTIFPEANFHRAREVPGPDPRFGSVHTIYAAVSHVVSAAPERVWEAGRLLSGPLLWVTFLELAFVILRRAGPSLLSTLLAMLVLGGARFSVGAVAMYPLWVGMAGVWLVCARWLERGSGRCHSNVDVLIFAALPLIHYFPWMLASMAGVLLLLAAGLHYRTRVPPRPRLVHAASLLGLAAAVLVVRLLISYGRENPIHQESWNILSIAGPWIAFQPATVYGSISILGLLGPLAWWIARRTPDGCDPLAWKWVGWTTLIPFLLPLNPVAVTVLHPILGFLVYRLSLGALYPIVWGELLSRGARVRPRLAKPLTVGFGAALAAAVLFAGASGSRQEGPRFDADTRAAIRQIAVELPPDAVVLSDPYSMLGFTAFSPISVVAVPDGRSSPRDARARERLLAAVLAFDPAATDRMVRVPVHEFGATHLVVHDWDQSLRGYMVDLDSKAFPGIADAMTSAGAEELEGPWPKRWRVFSLRPLEDDASSLEPEPTASMDAELVHCEVSPAALSAGQRVTVRAKWNLVPASDRQGIPKVYLRLDRRPLTGGDAPAGKIWRKIRERWTGQRERLRTSSTPPLAAVVRAAWDGVPIQTQHEFTIPTSLKPGTYELQLRWQVDQRSHVEHLSGLFNNRDSYSGTTAATLEIRP